MPEDNQPKACAPARHCPALLPHRLASQEQDRPWPLVKEVRDGRHRSGLGSCCCPGCSLARVSLPGLLARLRHPQPEKQQVALFACPAPVQGQAGMSPLVCGGRWVSWQADGHELWPLPALLPSLPAAACESQQPLPALGEVEAGLWERAVELSTGMSHWGPTALAGLLLG